VLASKKKQEGNARFSAGDYKEAVALYTQAIELVDRSEGGDYYGNRCAAYKMAGDYASALQDGLIAIELTPANLKLYPRVAECHLHFGEFEQAIELLRGAQKLQDGKSNPQIAKTLQQAETLQRYVTQVKNLISQGAFSQALTLIPQIESVAKESTAVKLLHIRCLVELKKVAQALSMCNTLYNQGCRDDKLVTLRGKCLYLNGDHDKANLHFKQVLSNDPDNSECRTLFKLIKQLDKSKEEANTLFKEGKMSPAYDAYTAALSLDPTNNHFNTIIYRNRAAAALKLRRYDQAIDDCTKCIEFNAEDLKAYQRRADAYLAKEMYTEAVRDLEAALKHAPRDQDLTRKLRQAQLDLKKSLRKDYYKILGVSKDASQSEVKKAFKRQALSLHPDRPQNNETEEKRVAAEKAFKDLQEANETLNDDQKRAAYDRGDDLQEGMGMGGGMGGMGGMDLGSIFAMFGGMGGMGGMPGGMRFRSAGGHGHSHGGHGHSHGGRGGHSMFDDDDDD